MYDISTVSVTTGKHYSNKHTLEPKPHLKQYFEQPNIVRNTFFMQNIIPQSSVVITRVLNVYTCVTHDVLHQNYQITTMIFLIRNE